MLNRLKINYFSVSVSEIPIVSIILNSENTLNKQRLKLFHEIFSFNSYSRTLFSIGLWYARNDSNLLPELFWLRNQKAEPHIDIGSDFSDLILIPAYWEILIKIGKKWTFLL